VVSFWIGVDLHKANFRKLAKVFPNTNGWDPKERLTVYASKEVDSKLRQLAYQEALKVVANPNTDLKEFHWVANQGRIDEDFNLMTGR
jgi:hypothetical protein